MREGPVELKGTLRILSVMPAKLDTRTKPHKTSNYECPVSSIQNTLQCVHRVHILYLYVKWVSATSVGYFQDYMR